MSQKSPDSRVYAINECLKKNVRDIYRLRKVYWGDVGEQRVHAYALSFNRIYNETLEQRVKAFYNTCQTVLSDDEILLTDDRAFTILSPKFKVTYCLEVWRKSADKRCYMEDGQVVTEFLHRMSCEQAAKVFKDHFFDPIKALQDPTVLPDYRDPADRYAALAKADVLKSFLPPQKLRTEDSVCTTSQKNHILKDFFKTFRRI